MMHAPDLDAAEASGNIQALVRAIDATGLYLRNAPIDEMGAIGKRLKRLVAEGSDWRVRKAVARAVRHLQDNEIAEPLLENLANDEHAPVKQEAKRTIDLREEDLRTDVLRDNYEALMRRWLAELKRKQGIKAVRAASHVAEKYTELVFREVYHEAIRPFAALRVSLERIEDRLSKPTFDPAAAATAISEGRRRLDVVERVLLRMKQLTTVLTPKFQPTNLHELIADTIRIVQDSAPEVAGTMYVSCPDDLVVAGERELLVQALRNVLQNAAEACASTGRKPGIWVAAERVDSDTKVRISVRDNGCGIAEDEVDDARRAFTTTKPYGSGFGLPLARRFVHAHRGSLSLESKQGVGTTVTIILPVKQPRLREAQE
jgi:signal transduction histidine kinase